MKRIELKEIKQTRKAMLVQDASGRTAWIPKRWIREDMTVKVETFEKATGEYAAIQAVREEDKAFRDSYHDLGKIARETEKAIAIGVTIFEEHTDQSINRQAWFPKSLLRYGKAPGWFIEKKANELIDDNRMQNGGCYSLTIADREFCA